MRRIAARRLDGGFLAYLYVYLTKLLFGYLCGCAEQKILSIFSSSKYVGVVTEGEERSYALQVYNMQGKQEFRTEFDQDYTTLKFSGNNILIYNDFEYTMMNHAGNIFFEGTFEESISDLYTLSGNNRYMVLHAGKTDQIRLK